MYWLILANLKIFGTLLEGNLEQKDLWLLQFVLCIPVEKENHITYLFQIKCEQLFLVCHDYKNVFVFFSGLLTMSL